MDEISYDEYKKSNIENKCISTICSFKKSRIKEAISQVEKYEFTDNKYPKRIWALWGKTRNCNEWICLEVGSSKDIKGEIEQDLMLMIPQNEEITIASEVHNEILLFSYWKYANTHSNKYKTIYEMCNDFEWFEVNVEEYLKDNKESRKYNKINYAETNYAYEHKALFWNPSPVVYGNQEKEILSVLKKKIL